LYDAPFTLWDTETVSQTDPMIVMGSTKAQDSKEKSVESGQSRPEQPE
jgi:hypothetical protein